MPQSERRGWHFPAGQDEGHYFLEHERGRIWSLCESVSVPRGTTFWDSDVVTQEDCEICAGRYIAYQRVLKGAQA